MDKLFSFAFGGKSKNSRVWEPIGARAQEDLIRITYSSTPYASAEDAINQAVMRGGLAYRKNGELQDFPPAVMIELKNLLIQFNRWFLMFGMVVMFSAPERAPFFSVVPDPRSGYFVARFTREEIVEVGWRFHEQDNVAQVAQEKRPDPRASVFVWPGHSPDISAGQPFRSRLSVLLRPHAMIEEFRDNVLDGEYLGTHPPLITTLKMDNSFSGGDVEQSKRIDVTRSATEAARQGRTQNAHREISLNRQQLDAQTDYDETAKVIYNTSKRRAGYTADGERQKIIRGDLWNNRIPLRAGMQIERTPVPIAMPTWVDRERFFIETIYRALGVPMRGGSSGNYRRGQSGSAQTTMTGDDMLLMRNTVMGTRQDLIDAFSFMYSHFMSEASVAAAREHHSEVISQMDRNINSLKTYMDYLEKTDQLDTEPMIAQKQQLLRHNEQVERRRIIAERTNKIVIQAHRKGKFVDQQVVFQHLSDIYDMEQKLEEAKQHAEKDIDGMLDVTLEFRHPPNVDADHLLQLARDGFMNPREAMSLYAVASGISEDRVSSALEGVDFVPLQRKAEMELQREESAKKMKLDRDRLEFEKTKEENRVRLESKKIAAAEKASQQQDSGEKRKDAQETKTPNKKKK